MSDQITRALGADDFLAYRTTQESIPPRLSRAQLQEIAKTRPEIPDLASLSQSVTLSARHPFVDGGNFIDVYRPGRWDCASDNIFMDTIVQGTSPGNWNGSVAYCTFTAKATGQHLFVAYFAGWNITTMRMFGPWGESDGHPSSSSTSGAVLALANASAGQKVSFSISCIGPNNMPGLGFLQSVEMLY